MKISGLILVWCLLVISSDAASTVGRELQSGVTAIKQPIDETLTFIGSSQCENVKKIVGVAYDQVDDEKEPDVNQLSLVFRSSKLTVAYNITYAAEALSKDFDYAPGSKFVVFVHGFTDDPYSDSFGSISDAFLNTGEYNVVALDGSPLIRWFYLRSTTYVRFMGEKLGLVLATMTQNGVKPEDLLLVGHSLGSHISSFAGKTFNKVTGKKVGRISGLDPAGPCFSFVDPELRLRASDAQFVDVMHTDAGVYGLEDAVGHVDFYPNGGSQQPNCLFQTCSHSRAWLYYSESVVNPKAFPAVRCDSWDDFKDGKCGDEIKYMGYPATSDTRGKFYLQTGEDSPYGLGNSGLEYQEKSVVKSILSGGQNAAKSVISGTVNIFG